MSVSDPVGERPVDRLNRPLHDLRISVTDRCNFRCQYCMPAEGLPWLKRDALLTYEEMARLVRVLAEMGVADVRLTGGEPLVRKGVMELVRALGLRVGTGLDELVLTTNGTRL